MNRILKLWALIWLAPRIVYALWCLFFTAEGRVHLATLRELARGKKS